MSAGPELQRVLTRLMPEGHAEAAIAQLIRCNCHFRLSPARSTKFGDFRAGRGPVKPIISVNRDLPPPLFLLTFLHELAHVEVWNAFHGRVAPHGKEWKNAYRNLTLPFVEAGAFPPEAKQSLLQHLASAPATLSRNSPLLRYLGLESDRIEGPRVRHLKPGEHFVISGGRKFVLGEKRRTRYLCVDLGNKRQYLVHADTPVLASGEAMAE